MPKIINTGTDQLLANYNKGIVTLTLNNPKYKNALSEKLTPYLRRILKKINKDSKYKLLVIKGSGNSFCSGGNIKGMEEKNIKGKKTVKIKSLIKKQRGLTGLLYSLNIPTIAAITGATAGAGFSIALACDLRVGNKDSFFISNYSRVGLSGDYGISWFLTNQFGASKAKEIMMLNNRIYADEALRIGLLNFCFKKDFDKKLETICNDIVSQSSLAIKHIKSNINAASYFELHKSLEMEAYNLIDCSDSIEHKIAVKNFKKN